MHWNRNSVIPSFHFRKKIILLGDIVLFISNNARYAVALVFAYFSVRGLEEWIKDLKLYRRNHWNFELQRNSKFRQAIGSSVPVPSKIRVCLLGPIFVLGTAASSLISAFGSMKPQ